MVAAGLLAKESGREGLSVPPWVKTSLAPGSRVVTDYYDKSGLTQWLDKLRFNTVGYGCTTCIGNSGPLPTTSRKPSKPTRSSPSPSSVAIATSKAASTPKFAPTTSCPRRSSSPTPSRPHRPRLRPLAPGQRQVRPARFPPRHLALPTGSLHRHRFRHFFRQLYEGIRDRHPGRQQLAKLSFPTGDVYQWERDSTYIRKAVLRTHARAARSVHEISGAAFSPSSATPSPPTHISPAGSIKLTAQPENTSRTTA